jgi:tRNA nucleotidyltransferase/poly(A) polymerase
VDYVDFARVRGQDILSDLAARDFTINAIAIDVRNLESDPLPWIDPLHGREDIRARVIRATSACVFQDDPLRMLRAIRQSAKLGFDLSLETEALIVRDAPLIERVSDERVRDELAQIVAGNGAPRQVRRLASLGLLFRVLPELEGYSEQALCSLDNADNLLEALLDRSAWAGLSADVVSALFPYRNDLAGHFAQVLSDERDRALIFKMAALFCGVSVVSDTAAPDAALALRQVATDKQFDSPPQTTRSSTSQSQMATMALKRLRFSNRETTLLCAEVSSLQQLFTLARRECLDAHDRYRFFARHGQTGLDILCLSLVIGSAGDLPEHDRLGWSRLVEIVRELVAYYYQEWPRVVALPRLISGEDLMRELGLDPGPLVGELLKALREAQSVGELHSADEALVWASKHILADKQGLCKVRQGIEFPA